MHNIRTYFRRFSSRASRALLYRTWQADNIYFIPHELEYPPWFTFHTFLHDYRGLSRNVAWNFFIATWTLFSIVCVAIQLWGSYTYMWLDLIYNVVYLVHVSSIAYDSWLAMYGTSPSKTPFVIDALTFLQMVISFGSKEIFKLVSYYIRLHRTFSFLWALNVQAGIICTALKYCYIFMLLRCNLTLIWMNINEIETIRLMEATVSSNISNHRQYEDSLKDFFKSLYIINKMFIPVGPSMAIDTDVKRIFCLMFMFCGCLVVTGAAVASLSLVIGIYLRSEENFRARYRLIMKEMQQSNIPQSLRDKVETFYKMYWHKQRAVSETQLLPTFPLSLYSHVYMDIYFEAMQKSHILRDLDFQFLSELAKKMQTTHYIPGDAIIKRSSKKSSMIYLTYGDIEMLTAEDDSTPILRMTRGTVLSVCGICASAACARAHVEIRAATYCTAQVLEASDLWRIAWRRGRITGQGRLIQEAFYEHFIKVWRHYELRTKSAIRYKSSILHFKQNLMALKEATDSQGNPLLARADVFLEIAGCYILRNCEDISLSDEADAICLRPTFPCILQPMSSLLITWEFFIMFIILLVCLLYPYYLVFARYVSWEFRVLDYFITFVFLVDMMVYLSTGTHVEEGVPITLSQTASQQIISYWFLLDVAAVMPIFQFIGEGHFAGINKLLRIPKIFRNLKSLEDVFVYQSNTLRFLSYTFLMLVACYLIAAFQQGYMCFKLDRCAVANFTHPPYWVSQSEEVSIERVLMFGLFWAVSLITFTAHMENWTTIEYDEMIAYTMILLEVCIVLHIFIEAVYSATIIVTSALSEQYDACIANVKNVLNRSGVDSQLSQRFTRYLQLCWYTDKAYSMIHKKSIFFDLPPHVYQDILSRQRSKYILSIPFMKLLNNEELTKVSSSARIFYTSPNEILLNTGDITNEMYVIIQGYCEILNPHTKEVVGSLGQKGHFGVLDCLLRFPVFYTIRAVTHVQLFSISRKLLINSFETNLRLKDAIEFAKEQPEYLSLLIRREAFVQYKQLPPIPNTEHFRRPRKHEMDSEYLEPFQTFGALSVLRYIFPRFTIRPDGKYLSRYESFRAVCAFTTAMLVPGYTYLVIQYPFLKSLLKALDFAAYFDVIQRMLIGYYNDKGILVYHPATTALHYLKGAFFIDIFSCVPLEILENPRESHRHWYRVSLTHQFLLLNRLGQLYRLPSAMIMLKDYIERKDILVVLKSLPIFMALLNVVTCTFVLCSVDVFVSNFYKTFYLEPHADLGGSWVHLFKDSFRFNVTETTFHLHMASLFWVVYQTTTIGYKVHVPTGINQMILFFIGMIVSAMMLTYVSVRIISIRANVNTVLATYQEHMTDIVTYMKREQLDKKLKTEVIEYYRYNWNMLGGVDYRNILKLCDQIPLRTDVILHLYGPTFFQCRIVSDCDVSLLRVLGRAVRSMYFLEDTVLYQVDDVLRDVYLVDFGSVEAEYTNEEGLEVNAMLEKGSIFGNLQGAKTMTCPVKFSAKTDVHLLRIHANVFHNIVADQPGLLDKLVNLRPSNEPFVQGHVNESFRKSDIVEALNSKSISTIKRWYLRYLVSNNPFVQVYLILVSISCVYLDFYNAGFQDNRLIIIILLYALDAAFYAKIIIRYLLPYMVTNHAVKVFLLKGRERYIKQELKYDTLSGIPIELLAFWFAKDPWMWFSILRLNRVFRTATVQKCLAHYHERVNINVSCTTVVSTLIWFTLFVHGSSCLWHFIGYREEQQKAKSSWFYKDNGTLWCSNKYICAFYFVTTTYTQNGVGDIMPKKLAEVIFVSMLMIVSTMLYLVHVGEFCNIIQYQSFRNFAFYMKYLELQDFLKNNRVSKNLIKVVNRYAMHLWRESRGEQLPNFLKKAPLCLKLKIMSAAYMKHFYTHPLFSLCEPAFLRQLMVHIQVFTYNDDMFVVRAGEVTDTMYIIHCGEVLEIASDGAIVKAYNPGDYFGLLQGLKRNVPFVNSYHTFHKSHILSLSMDDWQSLLVHFPVSREKIFDYYRGINPDTNSPDSGFFGFSDPLISEPVWPEANFTQFFERRGNDHYRKHGLATASSLTYSNIGKRSSSSIWLRKFQETYAQSMENFDENDRLVTDEVEEVSFDLGQPDRANREVVTDAMGNTEDDIDRTKFDKSMSDELVLDRVPNRSAKRVTYQDEMPSTSGVPNKSNEDAEKMESDNDNVDDDDKSKKDSDKDNDESSS